MSTTAQSSAADASRRAKERERNADYTSGGIVRAVIPPYGPFQLNDSVTLEDAIAYAFGALTLDNWPEVKAELARHIRHNYQPVASETRTW